MRNYYAMLDLPITEPFSGLHAAYRDFIRSIDTLGTAAYSVQTEETFQAFSVLLDSIRRRAYHEQMRRASERDLLNKRIESPSVTEVTSILGEPESVHPSFEEILSRLLRNFTNHAVPKSEHPENLSVQVKVATEQRAGAPFDLGVPTFAICPACRGGASSWPYQCTLCAGRGRIEQVQPMRVAVPPRVPAEVHRGLEPFGIQNFFLSVRFTR
jgi:DnaJ-class molecular chaperone